MQDTNIQNYMRLVNVVKGPIWTLCSQNTKYGSGFELWRTGDNQITLELMDDNGTRGKVIDSVVLDFDFPVSSVSGLSESGWIHRVAKMLESELFDKQD